LAGYLGIADVALSKFKTESLIGFLNAVMCNKISLFIHFLQILFGTCHRQRYLSVESQIVIIDRGLTSLISCHFSKFEMSI
jgi:hypothetical protein